MEYHDGSERPRLTERNLAACLSLKAALYRSLMQHAGFACRLSLEDETLEPKVHGDKTEIESILLNALMEFKDTYAFDEYIWEWMLDIVLSSFEADQFCAERDSADERQAAYWRKRLQQRLSRVKLGWLLDPEYYAHEAAQSAIYAKAAAIIRSVLEDDDLMEGVVA